MVTPQRQCPKTEKWRKERRGETEEWRGDAGNGLSIAVLKEVIEYQLMLQAAAHVHNQQDLLFVSGRNLFWRSEQKKENSVRGPEEVQGYVRCKRVEPHKACAALDGEAWSAGLGVSFSSTWCMCRARQFYSNIRWCFYFFLLHETLHTIVTFKFWQKPRTVVGLLIFTTSFTESLNFYYCEEQLHSLTH